MRKSLLITALLIGATSFGQCLSVINGRMSSPFDRGNLENHWYFGGQFDINNAFDIVETDTEPQGLDYDVEVGLRKYAFAYYVFYGEYAKIEYTNYGLGIDYFAINTRNIDVAIGVNAGVISKPTPLTTGDVSYFTFAGRLKGLYSLTPYLGLTLTGQYQQRPDRDINGVLEVMAGLQINIK